ncbi:MAG: hypothetical protein WC943_14065, partial [Elusimicrobiota bacterium]
MVRAIVTAALRGRALAPALVLLAGLTIPGCAPSVATKRTLNALVASQDFEGAEAYMLKVRETPNYGKKNAVLYYLDLGTIQHHAGKYKESDANFEKAENRMREL